MLFFRVCEGTRAPEVVLREQIAKYRQVTFPVFSFPDTQNLETFEIFNLGFRFRNKGLLGSYTPVSIPHSCDNDQHEWSLLHSDESKSITLHNNKHERLFVTHLPTSHVIISNTRLTETERQIFTCQNLSSKKIKNIKGYYCGIQVEGPHLTLGDPHFYSGFYPLYLC